MNNSELASRVAIQTLVTKAIAERVAAAFATLASAVVRSEMVWITGFRTFATRNRLARRTGSQGTGVGIAFAALIGRLFSGRRQRHCTDYRDRKPLPYRHTAVHILARRSHDGAARDLHPNCGVPQVTARPPPDSPLEQPHCRQGSSPGSSGPHPPRNSGS